MLITPFTEEFRSKTLQSGDSSEKTIVERATATLTRCEATPASRCPSPKTFVDKKSTSTKKINSDNCSVAARLCRRRSGEQLRSNCESRPDEEKTFVDPGSDQPPMRGGASEPHGGRVN